MQLKRTSYGKQVVAIEKLLYGGHPPLALPGPPPSGPHQQQQQMQLQQPPTGPLATVKAVGRDVARPIHQIQFGNQPPFHYRPSDHRQMGVQDHRSQQQHYYAPHRQHNASVSRR
jgi:hypothetical protein